MVLGTLQCTIVHDGTKHTMTVRHESGFAVTSDISQEQFQSFLAQGAGELERWPVP
jgi:hypothetical protein